MINVKTAFPRLYELEQKYGSLIKGAIKSSRQRKKSNEKSKQSAKTFSFKKGMQTLTDAIYLKILEDVYLNTSVNNISLKNDFGEKRFSLNITKDVENITDGFDAVVISTPSYSSSELFKKLDSDFSSELHEIYYPPVNVIYTGFNQSKINHKLDGFGYLIPEQEKRKILGSLWSSSLFPGRAPEGYCALTSFVGGARSPKLTGMDDKDLVKITVEELNSVLGVNGEPDYVKIVKWEKAIPQYNNHYTDLYESIENFQNKFKGIFICNNFYKGIAVGDCIKNADLTVTGVVNFLKE
jgi:oxygen-dependent protoporphyrinogen oxidase